MLRMAAARIATLVLATAVATSAGHAQPPQRWTPASLASEAYESSPSFSPDGREVVFMRADRQFQHYRLLWSRCEGGRWTPPVAPPFAASAPVLEADPYFTPDGRQLYFISSRGAAPDNVEDLDIWVVDRASDGSWGSPRRLPPPVNSSGSELLPRLDAQGRLVFGSDRAGGHGQSDIYFATPQPGGGWLVDNAGPPINTAGSEYEAEPSRDGRALVVVSDRGDRSHLYRYRRDDAGRWVEQGRVEARTDVFQVGPLLSPLGEKLLFAQADGERSGEWFVSELLPGSTEAWPPDCRDKR
jgi:Tol biopolymer transport system component